MNLYSQFETNNTLEAEGVDINYGSNEQADGDIIITIARAGGKNASYIKEMEKVSRRYQVQIKSQTLDPALAETVLREVYARSVILGWRNVTDKSGQKIPFTVENCIKLLTDLPEFFKSIQECASNVNLFKDAIEQDNAKN